MRSRINTRGAGILPALQQAKNLFSPTIRKGMIFAWIIAFILGTFAGKKLADKGFSADHRFDSDHHQGWFLGGISAIAFIVVLLLILYKLDQVKLVYLVIPTIIILYIGEYLYDVVIALGFFVIGLLIALEFQPKKNLKQMIQLFVATLAISIPISILIHYSLPIINLVGEPKIIDGVVLQTTSYTCAPSSIATLARFLGKAPNISERDVVKLTNTDKNGTSTLSEIRAMRKLGLGAEFRPNLTVDDLVNINKSGLLHVKVKYKGKEISHTVALLSINPKTRTLIIGDPLSGIQVKRFDQLKGYWMNEVVFVNSSNTADCK